MFIRSCTISLIVFSCFGIEASHAFVSAGVSVHEVRVNTYTRSSQDHAALDYQSDGQLAVVWDSRRQQQGRYGIYLQRFSAIGIPVGSETQVNQTQTGMHMNPAVSADKKGGLWVVWESFGKDGDRGAIAARYMIPGRTALPEFQVNAIGTRNQHDVVVASDPDGNAFFAWCSPDSGVGLSNVVARCFQKSGKPMTDEFVITKDEETRGKRPQPSIVMTSSGQAGVIWASTDSEGSPTGLYWRCYDWDGNATTPSICLVNRPAIEPAIACHPDGRLAVAWIESCGLEYAAFWRMFTDSGKPLGPVHRLSQPLQQQVSGVALAWREGKDLVASWNAINLNGDSDVYLATLVPSFLSHEKYTYGTIHQKGTQRIDIASGKKRIGIDDTGTIAIVWFGEADQGDSTSVNLTMHVPDGSLCCLRSPSKTGNENVSENYARPHIIPMFDPLRASVRRDSRSPESHKRGLLQGFVGITDTGWDPPDPMVAAGPDNLTAVTNGRVAFFTKNGVMTFSLHMHGDTGFWRETGVESNQIIDPEVVYDPLSQRFWIIASECEALYGKSYLLLAVSDDSDPNGDWYKYRIDVSRFAGAVFDSPNLGIDDEVVYVSGDAVGQTGDYVIYIFEKETLLAGLPHGNPWVIRMPDDYSASGVARMICETAPAQYYIRHKDGVSQTQIELLAILDPLGERETQSHTLTVPTYDEPVDPPQLGTTVRPNLFDARFWSVLFRNGSLWAAHHVGPTPTRVRWYEIDMQGWPESLNQPALVQWGEIDSGEENWTFFPSLDVDNDGNLVCTFSSSSADTYISIGHVHRLADDTPGTLRKVRISKTSTFPDTTGRWGDYSGTSLDPVSPGIFWTIHEYVPPAGGWNTWIEEYSVYSCLNAGDWNEDCMVDEEDWQFFADCFTGPNEEVYHECICFDFDSNGMVDLVDASFFQSTFSPGVLIPGCE